MDTSPPTLTPEVKRRAQLAAFVAFATNGALVGSLLPRYPEVADALELTTGRLGFVVAAFAIGAALAGGFPERPLRRFGTAAVTVTGTWAIAVALAVAAASAQLGPEAVWLFVLCLGFAGFADANVDVAQNVEGLKIQAELGYSVLATMHAGWSAGAAVSGVFGTVAASFSVPLGVHLLTTGATCGLLVTVAARRFLPRQPVSYPTQHDPRPSPADPVQDRSSGRRLLLVSVLVALSGLSVEAIGNDWSAWFVREVHQVETNRAGLAVATVLGAQFVGRALGDRAINRFGESLALRSSLLLVFGGLLTASWAPDVWPTFLGFAVAGLGSATTVPIAFARADRLPGLAPGRGIAVVGFFMRATALAVTPTVGVIGDVAGLPVALSLIGCFALVALIPAWRRHHTSGGF